MIIGCDIGGVVKEMTSDNPIINSIETIKKLEDQGHQIIFISKCKDNFRIVLSQWLKSNNLNNQVFFCNEYSEKCAICIRLKVGYMIDDKLQVFKEIPESIKKIWLISDEKKISGAYKFQPNEVSKVSICGDWDEIFQIICG